MSDTQRIHPSPDLEAANASRPSAPLIPPSTAKSDKSYPLPAYPPPLPPPRRKRSCRLCRCVCCTLCSLIIFIILFAGVFAAVLFLGFHPKIPHYSIDAIQVDSLVLSNDGSLSASFGVNLTAENPNKRIGIYYEGGSSLSAWFNETELCHGSLPVFYQGHRNTTVMNVLLSGQVANAAALAADLQTEQQNSGGVPLLIKGKVPVRIKMGKLKLMKIRFKAKCDIVVDSLTSNTRVRIKSSSCDIKLNRIFGITF